jgi:tRNA(Leu) C34 or U34 (ribose-2'-O)-methylase TrmL
MFGFNVLTNAELKAIRNAAFERGERHGKEIAINYLRDIQKYDCKPLNDFEKAIVMKFLDEYNLEFGYNAFEGGFYVFKRTK